MNYYNNGFVNPYYSQQIPMQMPMQNMQQNMQQNVRPVEQNYVQPNLQMNQQVYKPQPIGLQGKVVDSIDVVKATEIPYDYSVSYFPLTDGSAIVTKQLMQDGTSKTTVFKPVEEKEVEKQEPKYITVEEFDETIKKIEKNSNFDDELKKLKRNIEDLQDDVRKIKK